MRGIVAGRNVVDAVRRARSVVGGHVGRGRVASRLQRGERNA